MKPEKVDQQRHVHILRVDGVVDEIAVDTPLLGHCEVFMGMPDGSWKHLGTSEVLAYRQVVYERGDG